MESDMLQPWGMQYNNKLTPPCHCPLPHRKRIHLTLLGNKVPLASVIHTMLCVKLQNVKAYISQSWIRFFFLSNFPNTLKTLLFKTENCLISFHPKVQSSLKESSGYILGLFTIIYTHRGALKYEFCSWNKDLKAQFCAIQWLQRRWEILFSQLSYL